VKNLKKYKSKKKWRFVHYVRALYRPAAAATTATATVTTTTTTITTTSTTACKRETFKLFTFKHTK